MIGIFFYSQNFLDTVKIFVRADAEVQVELERLTAAWRTGFAMLRFKVQKLDPTAQKAKYLPGKRGTEGQYCRYELQ